MLGLAMHDVGLGRTRSTSSGRRTSRSRSRQPTSCCPDDVIGCNDPGTVCCDAPECSTPKSGAGGDGQEDDCIECKQGIPTDVCTDDCFKAPTGVRSVAIVEPDDCTECKEHPETVVPCDDPACEAEQLLEWDEDAVDELLKCCCNGSDHHHTSFTTSYSQHHKGAHTHSHSHTTLEPSLPFAETAATFDYQLPIHTRAGFPPSTANTSSSRSSRSDFSAPSTSTASFAYTSPALPDTSAPKSGVRDSPATQPPQFPSGHFHHLSHLQAPSVHHYTFQPEVHGHSVRHAHAAPTSSSPAPALQSNSANLFRCQWADCSLKFSTREELVGHANVTHLLLAQPTQPLQAVDVALPTQMSHEPHRTKADAPADLSSIFSISGEGSFDHTLRCLWDSCNTAIPWLPQQALEANIPVVPATTAVVHGSAPMDSTNSCAMVPATSDGGLQDQTTASLVKHLLQDHLHIPPNVLMQLSPGLGQSFNFYPPANSNDIVSHGHYGSHTFGHPEQQHHERTPSSLLPLRAQAVEEHQRTPSVASLHSSTHGSIVRNSAISSLGTFPEVSPQVLPDSLPTVADWNGFASYDSTPASTRAASPSAQSTPLSTAKPLHTCRWKDCAAKFPDTAGLMDHISDAHIGAGKSLYHCHWEGCDRGAEGRGFNQRQKVMRHVRTHVGDKPFACPECGRGFSESTTLAQHIRTHTNEKPFLCPHQDCGKSFAIQSALTIHLRTHSGEKPFKCPHPGCEMSFAESSNLSKHVKTHQVERERREGTAGTGSALSWDGTSKVSSGKRKRKHESIGSWDDLNQTVKNVRM